MAGRHKLLRPFPERPIVRCAAEAAIASEVGPLGVVVPSAGDAVAAALEGLPLELIENPEAERGVSTSVRAAATWAFPRAAALILLLADEPQVSPRVIRGLAQRWRARETPALRSVYRDRPGHPVLVTPRFLEEAAPDEGDRGLGDRLETGRVEAFRVEQDAPTDIDTEAAYREALARLAH